MKRLITVILTICMIIPVMNIYATDIPFEDVLKKAGITGNEL